MEKKTLKMKKLRDYCTMSPDGSWGEACRLHDVHYRKIWEERLIADTAFNEIMIAHGAPLWVAKLYYWCVRIFGRFYV